MSCIVQLLLHKGKYLVSDYAAFALETVNRELTRVSAEHSH
jgi:hypothetical protein